MDNVFPSNVMPVAADACSLEGSVSANSTVLNDRGAVDASVTESEDVDAVGCMSIVD